MWKANYGLTTSLKNLDKENLTFPREEFIFFSPRILDRHLARVSVKVSAHVSELCKKQRTFSD